MLALDSPTTEGPPMATKSTKAPPGVLSAADVAALWTEVAREQYEQRAAARDAENAERRRRGRKLRPPLLPFRPIKSETALSYLRDSADTPLPDGSPRRYADHPVPAPAGRFGLMPWWSDDQREELRHWFQDRPGYGHGTGGRYAGRLRESRS